MALVSQILGGLSPETAESYPNGSFMYRVLGGLSFNPASTGDPDVGRSQSIEEHNEALNRYLRPGMDPMMRAWAIQKGIEAERALPSFWGESQPRRTMNAGSKAVSGVRINPDNTISVQFGNKGKWYTYRGGSNRYDASLEANRLMMSPSIDRAIGRDGSWSLTHKLY